MSIEAYPSPNGVLTSLIWRKTMSGGETSLSGYDNASQALSYTPGQEQVYLNGILLVRGDDYTATNGTSITGLSALAASDFIQVNCYNNFSVASLPTSGLTGTISNAQLQNSAITINGTSAALGGTYTNPAGSTSAAGILQLTDSTSSTSTSTAATPNSVKSAYDLANGAIPKTLTTTTGDIIYASSANTPARLGIGSTGQLLGVSGGVPAWTAAPSSGGMTVIASGSFSGSSTLIPSIPTTYKQLLLQIDGWYFPTTGWGLYLRLNDDSTASRYYNSLAFATSSGQVAFADSKFYLSFDNYGLNGSGYGSVTCSLPNYASTTSYKQAIIYGVGQGNSTNPGYITYQANGGVYNQTTAVTSLRITNGAGAAQNGTYTLYGVS